MTIRKPTISLAAFSTAALLAVAAFPAAAAAAEVVPPGNSAATQYTEAFPTSGGDEKTDQAARHRSPTKVLGGRNARKLEERGADGSAAAEVAAATAPVALADAGGATTSTPADDRTRGGGGSSGGDGGAARTGGSTDASAGVEPVRVDQPAGSSGLGSALGQATGLSDSDGSDLLLPLFILAALAWSLAYLWRQRRSVG